MFIADTFSASIQVNVFAVVVAHCTVRHFLRVLKCI